MAKILTRFIPSAARNLSVQKSKEEGFLAALGMTRSGFFPAMWEDFVASIPGAACGEDFLGLFPQQRAIRRKERQLLLDNLLGVF